jgi:hypothetical protein
MKQAGGQKQKHERKGIQCARPEMIVCLVDVSGIGHEDHAAHHAANEGNAV